ncbi:Uncharacterised protein [Vibrio cholerae]|nr:Uncharacterised protein [Vibrio cholerae]CSC74558.1 Uncharacterised protein [Vibrio cholerae]
MHPSRIDFHKAAARFNGNLGARFNHHFLSRFYMDLCTRFIDPNFACFHMQRAFNTQHLLARYRFSTFPLHRQVLVVLNLGKLVVFNGQVMVVTNDRGVVVFNQTIEVFLRMQVDLLFARLVFKTELVKALPLVRLGAQHGFGFVLRQGVWRRVGRMISAASDNRLVWVTV